MMTRRDFLMRSAALTATLTSPFAFAADAKKGLRLGLTTYMIGSKWTIPELIEFLPGFGIFGVELRTDMKFAHGMELASGKEARAEAARRFADSPVHMHDLTAENYTQAKFYETQLAFLSRVGWNGFCMLEVGDKPDNEARFKEIERQKRRWDELTATV